MSISLFHRFQALLLTFLICFQMMGWQLIWQMKQYDAYRTASHTLETSDAVLHEYVVDLSSFHAARVGSREVHLRGHLYDIKSSQIRGDSIHLKLYHDQLEEYLFSMLSSVHTSIFNAHSADGVHVLLHTFFSVYELISPVFLCFLKEYISLWSPMFYYNGGSSMIGLPPLSPPPKTPFIVCFFKGTMC